MPKDSPHPNNDEVCERCVAGVLFHDVYIPSPGVTYTDAVAVEVIPVK